MGMGARKREWTDTTLLSKDECLGPVQSLV